MASRCSYFYKLFVIKNFLAGVVKKKKTVRNVLRYLQSRIFDKFNACYAILNFPEQWSELLVRVIIFLKTRIKIVPLQHVKHQISFTGTAGSNN